MDKRLAIAGLTVAFVFAACREAAAPDSLATRGGLAFDVGGGNSGMNLHPRGFGENSYAAWKAKEGQPDTRGKADHALYLQKLTETATFAAGVAVVDGLEGEPASALTVLSWEHRIGGWCGGGAPRWNVGLFDTDGNPRTVFLGCFAASHDPGNAAGWVLDSWNVQAEIAAAALAGGWTPATIRGLAIVFDEGTDAAGPLAPPTPGFVFLDNITVNTKTWTSPSDNGGN